MTTFHDPNFLDLYHSDEGTYDDNEALLEISFFFESVDVYEYGIKHVSQRCEKCVTIVRYWAEKKESMDYISDL